MRITSIEKAQRGGKFRISFDQGDDLSLSQDILVDFGLRRNDEISSETLLKIRNSQSYHDTYAAAVRLLNYRMRTKHELVQRLKQKQFPKDIIDRVMDKLDGLGLIDDSRFADAYISSKISSKPVGKRVLEVKLREKGIRKDIVSKAISSVCEDEAQLELASRAVGTKMRSLRRFDPVKRKEKLIAFLARRGFDWSIIKKVVSATLPDERSPGNGESDDGDF